MAGAKHTEQNGCTKSIRVRGNVPQLELEHGTDWVGWRSHATAYGPVLMTCDGARVSRYSVDAMRCMEYPLFSATWSTFGSGLDAMRW